MECQIKVNEANCTCTYEPCGRKGKCCQCILYHRSHSELPGCFFPEKFERTYDRSIAKFVEIFSKGLR